MRSIVRSILTVAIVAVTSLAVSDSAHAALEDVCSSTKSLGGVKYKAIPSDHITTGPRVGGISLIFKRGVSLPRTSCLSVYDSQGKLLAKMGKYSPNGNIFGARYYSGFGCAGRTRASTIASRAQNNTGNRKGYINVGGTSCYLVNDLRRDEGSVR